MSLLSTLASLFASSVLLSTLAANQGAVGVDVAFVGPPAIEAVVPASLMSELPAVEELDVWEEDGELEEEGERDPTLLERAAACARAGDHEDLDCELPVSPGVVAYHRATGRVAMLWSDVVGGGTECADVEGLILRASDGFQVASRLLVDGERCEEDWEAESESPATWRWLAYLAARGYEPVEDVVLDSVGPWGEDPGAAAMLGGTLRGWTLFLEPRDEELRVLLVAPGNQAAFELGSAPIVEELCWEDDPDSDCTLDNPFFRDVAVSPDGAYLIVTHGMTGASCRSDSEYERYIAPLPGRPVAPLQ